jgi:hypothetical protein
VAVLAAFIGKKRWEQAELARHVGVGARTLRSVLVDLETHGVPLTRKEHSGREVHWSVPPAWLPKGRGAHQQPGFQRGCACSGGCPGARGRDELLKVLMGASGESPSRAPTAKTPPLSWPRSRTACATAAPCASCTHPRTAPSRAPVSSRCSTWRTARTSASSASSTPLASSPGTGPTACCRSPQRGPSPIGTSRRTTCATS